MSVPQRFGVLAVALRNISQSFSSQKDRSQESSLYFRRACLAAEEERWDSALVFCGKAIEANPRNLTARLLLARIHDRALGNVDAAVAGYRKVIALAGYDSRDPRCRAAREALDELVQQAAADAAAPEPRLSDEDPAPDAPPAS